MSVTMNFWAIACVCIVGYMVYSGHLHSELQQIKSILVIVYENMERGTTRIIDEIDSLKTDTFIMLTNLQNNTIRTWDAVVKNGKKITNLDDKINMLLIKNGMIMQQQQQQHHHQQQQQ
jgi:hypothetical protein